MKSNYLILSVLLTLFCLGGCNKNKSTPAQPAQSPVSVSTDVVTDFIPDVGKYGTVAECPVNKEKLVIAKGTTALKYKNNVYYMCCPSCAQQFKQNPEKYMNVN